jgi:sugar diacid utilization regulator
VSERRRGDMLSAILDDPALAGPAATALGIPTGRPLRMAAISVAEQSLGEPITACHQTLELAILHCRAELGFSAATVRSDLVHVLLPVGPAGTDDAALTRLLTGIDAHARRSYGYRLVIGVGGVVTELADAATSMAQAARVVSMISRDLGGTDGECPAIGFSESYTARMALLALAEHRAGFDDAAGNTIAAMFEYDVANAADYVPTLKAFFDAHGNISAMAAALHVHPNTCRYRLSRMVEVFGIDLEDPDVRLVLGLQLRLHELTG